MKRKAISAERERKKVKIKKTAKSLSAEKQFELENRLMEMLAQEEVIISRKQAGKTIKQLDKMISISFTKEKADEFNVLDLFLRLPEEILITMSIIKPPIILQFLQALNNEKQENELQNMVEVLLFLRPGTSKCLLCDFLSKKFPKDKELHMLDGLELCWSRTDTLNMEIGSAAILFSYIRVYNGLHNRYDSESVESITSFNKKHGLDDNIFYDACLDIDILSSVFLVICWYYRREWAPIYSFNTHPENLREMEEFMNSEKIEDSSVPNPTARSYSELFIAAKNFFYILQRLSALKNDEEYNNIKAISLTDVSPELQTGPSGNVEIFSKNIENLTREEVRLATEMVTARVVTIQTIFSSIRSKHNFSESLDMNLKRKLLSLKSSNTHKKIGRL